MQKDSFYFSHDANARKDEKILCLLAEHGYTGYGIYWVLIEMMFENTDTAISRKLIKGIAYDLRVDIALLESVIATCNDVKLFNSDDEKIWSNSLRRRKAEWEQKKKKRSEAGKAGMAARWHSDNNVIKIDNKRITNDNKGKEKKVKERKVYITPTADQVKSFYEQQIANNSTQEFIANYQKLVGFLYGKNDKDEPYKNILSMKEQISYRQYLSMKATSEKTDVTIKEILDEMENRQDVAIKNISASATAMNWMRRNYNKRIAVA